MGVFQHVACRGRKRLGAFFRWLRLAVPAWHYAPVRCLAQTFSLLLFLYLLFYVAWPFAGTFLPLALEDKECVPVEIYLWADPLVGLSTAIAARSWNVALWGLGAVLLVSLLFPRGFCGYVCPLGTLIDGIDWLFSRFRKPSGKKAAGRRQTVRFALLVGVCVAAACGTLLSGYVAPIPVLTRGLVFSVGRWQFGATRGWSHMQQSDAAVQVSVALLGVVLLLSLCGRRLWCRLLCPSGALLSCASWFRLTERKLSAACTRCGRCVDVCSFDAIEPDFSTRTMACTSCRSCSGICPVRAIDFGWRWFRPCGHDEGADPVVGFGGWPLSRREMLASVSGGLVAVLGTRLHARPNGNLLRPPGAVSETRFLDLCIRCGECFKVCPGPVLHPSGLANGVDALWTPVVVPVRAGCHPDCALCTQVCPTGAIRPLALEEKRRTRMGSANVDTRACLAFAGESECRYCFDECAAAGYHAIEMRRIELDIDLAHIPEGAFSEVELDEMRHIEAPFVDPQVCVGCGLCEYRCHAANVRQRKRLAWSAVTILPPNEN